MMFQNCVINFFTMDFKVDRFFNFTEESEEQYLPVLSIRYFGTHADITSCPRDNEFQE
ncbi:hypothetical protein [uncultured Croceitalea sp.]|uniref:hypothetical protein n=1 Tax=uncultured Croceitalea sp. TaxID=1798908 RepID=UPI003305B262